MANSPSLQHSIFDSIKSVLGGWFHVRSWQLYFEHAEKIVVHPSYSGSARRMYRSTRVYVCDLVCLYVCMYVCNDFECVDVSCTLNLVNGFSVYLISDGVHF